MITKELCEQIRNDYDSLQKKALETIKALVNERGGRLNFDLDEGNAPSVTSMLFKDDLANCYVVERGDREKIMSLYIDGSVLKADLYALYIDVPQVGVNIEQDEQIDWCCLLKDLLPYM